MACDFCGQGRKVYRHVRIGAEDTAAMCFLCDREGQRGRVWDRKAGAYVNERARALALERDEARRAAEWLRSRPDVRPEEIEEIPF